MRLRGRACRIALWDHDRRVVALIVATGLGQWVLIGLCAPALLPPSSLPFLS
jgi:hypothetical protein